MKRLAAPMSVAVLLLVAGVALEAIAADDAPAAAPPPPKYRLVRQPVHGTEPRQWVFVVITPAGFPGVTTPEALEEYVELVVPEHATLEWSPGCCRIGGEPMGEAGELKAFADFCKRRTINFVHIPAG
jgi:hypothetical protein